MLPVAVAWKEDVEVGEQKGIKYRIQINEIPPRSVKKVLKNMKEWDASGEGYSFRNNRKLLLFSKVFANVRAWRKWARAFPYSLREIDERTGKEKKIKLGIDAKN